MIYDVTIIGAGIVGGAIARLLGRYNISVLCLEKEYDVCCGVSKSNTGIIHTPCLVPVNTKKADYNLRGNVMFNQLSEEMGVQLHWPGALILAYSEEDRETLEKYREQGEDTRRKHSLPKIKYTIIEKAELKKLEPGLNSKVLCALYAPDAGRIIPYELGTALWENALSNGVKLKLKKEVRSFEMEIKDDKKIWKIKTGNEEFKSRYIINSSGHGSNALGKNAGFDNASIMKVKGQYLIYDRERDFDVNHILFQVPEKGKGSSGKGILVCKTVYGNLMIGPDATSVDNEYDRGTDIKTLKSILLGARKSIPALDESKVIKTFAGIRPKPAGGDFIIESKNQFFHLCGIESPGLTSSPAIAEDVLKWLKEDGLILTEKAEIITKREPIVKERLNLSKEELKRRVQLPETDPEQIVCRCEQVPRSRIIDAMGRGIEIKTLDAVKRRTRAGQGRCQGTFCGKRVQKLLSDELGIPAVEITQRGDEPLGERVSKL